MRTISIVLLSAAVLLLILLVFTPCTTDHYADQVVHAGVGSIAGPIVQLDNYVGDSYEPLRDAEEDMDSVIVGKV